METISTNHTTNYTNHNYIYMKYILFLGSIVLEYDSITINLVYIFENEVPNYFCIFQSPCYEICGTRTLLLFMTSYIQRNLLL